MQQDWHACIDERSCFKGLPDFAEVVRVSFRLDPKFYRSEKGGLIFWEMHIDFLNCYGPVIALTEK
jgi:hypothetical protein